MVWNKPCSEVIALHSGVREVGSFEKCNSMSNVRTLFINFDLQAYKSSQEIGTCVKNLLESS